MKTLLGIGIPLLFFLTSFNQKTDKNPLYGKCEYFISDSDDTTKLDVTRSRTGRAFYRNRYLFEHKVSYKTEVINGSETETSEMSVYYCDGAVLYSNPQVSTILDYEIESVITLLEDNKTAYVSARNLMEEAANKYSKKNQTQDYIKTGKTKQILGFNCEEYTFQDKKTQSVFWISKEVKLAYDKSELFAIGYYKDLSGMLMESSTVDKKGVKTHMIMNEFKEEELEKELRNYEISIL